jgi:hypothetical protein
MNTKHVRLSAAAALGGHHSMPRGRSARARCRRWGCEAGVPGGCERVSARVPGLALARRAAIPNSCPLARMITATGISTMREYPSPERAPHDPDEKQTTDNQIEPRRATTENPLWFRWLDQPYDVMIVRYSCIGADCRMTSVVNADGPGLAWADRVRWLAQPQPASTPPPAAEGRFTSRRIRMGGNC